MKQELIPQVRNGVSIKQLIKLSRLPQKFVTKNGETYDKNWRKFYEAREKFNKGLHGCFYYLGDIVKQEHLDSELPNGDLRCKSCYRIKKLTSQNSRRVSTS